MKKLIITLSIIAAIVVTLSVITWVSMKSKDSQSDMNMTAKTEDSDDSKEQSQEVSTQATQTPAEQTVETIQPRDGQPMKEYNLIAQETKTEIAKGVSLTTWTYGDTVPGTEIRVTQGDFVKVNITNKLKVPTTIHWHGYHVASEMDGVPGYTQDAIMPGETFTYQFSADEVGTYWYHSHQESATQVDMGLYGALIVEPKNKPQLDEDYTLILDEWMKDQSKMDEMHSMSISSDNSDMSDTGGMSSMDGKDSTQTNDLEQQEEKMMKEAYNIYTVNGKSSDLIEPLKVKKGDVVQLRFINAGYRSHGLHIPGQIIKVVSSDGHVLQGAKELQDQIIIIAPGERYDIQFKVNSDEDFNIDFHDNNLYNDQMKIPVKVLDGSGKLLEENHSKELATFDLLSYGNYSEGKYTLDQTYAVEQNIELSSSTKDGKLIYTLNGKTFEDLPPLTVKTGDYVKLTYENKGKVDHPMHLHGHAFQVLSRNDQPYTGAPIIKDTLLIKPGDKYVIAFKADNPGNWVYHCHELHHAAGGMMQQVIYSDYKSSYVPKMDNASNNPE